MRKIFSFTLLLAFIGIALLLSGCEVDYYEPSEGDDNQGTGSSLFGDGITVPAGFDWATIKSGKLTVKVDDRYKGQYYYQVEIYDDNPIFSQEAKLLAKGVAKQGQDWLATVDLPAHLEVIWVRQISPIGQGVVKAVNISDGNLSVDFTPSTPGTPAQMRSASVSTEGGMVVTRAGDDGPSTVYSTPAIDGTTVLELSGEGNVSFAWNAPNYVIPAGKTFKGTLGFSWTNSILYVEGTWENTGSSDIALNGWTVIVQNGGKFINHTGDKTFKVNGTSQLIVAAGGEFGKTGTPMKLFQDGNDGKIINSGTIVTSGLFDIRYLYNLGEFNLNGKTEQIGSNCTIVNKGNFMINNGTGDANAALFQGNFQNDGTVKVSGTLHFPSNTFVLTNTGFFEVHTLGNSTPPGAQGTIHNTGQFVVTNDAFIELTFNVGTGALLEVKNLTMLNSAINLANQAMLTVTGTLSVAQSGEAKIIEGPASGTALAKINEVNVPNNRNFFLQGELEVECSNYYILPGSGTSENGKTTGEKVRFVEVGESTVFIPASDYNKGGNNNEVSGGGSIAPTTQMFPIIYNGISLTYMFEDGWPYLADYDMNDLVLDVTPTYNQNASNQVTQLQLYVVLRAAGATKRMAVGLQLDGIAPGMISGFSRTNNAGINGNVFQGNGLETGQTYAVIPLFDDVHEALGHSSALMTNTIKGSPNNVEPRSVTLTINFATPLDPTNISVDKFNLFIVNAGYKDKRQEIHLAGFQPTDKADRRKFGTADDNSNVTPYFAYNNMIWGLAIPGPAKYPVEWRSISLTYPGLESWATSGGSNAKDWYMNFNENSVYNQ